MFGFVWQVVCLFVCWIAVYVVLGDVCSFVCCDWWFCLAGFIVGLIVYLLC